MARKVDEAANFVSVQLIEQEPDMTNAIQTVLAGQNRFGLRKTFS
jgi:hypothetical protein